MKQNTKYRLPVAPEGGRSGSRKPVRGSLRGAAAALFACALLLGGCAKEPAEAPSGSADGLTSITLTPGAMGEVAMSTRSIADVGGTAVKDLWVVQLNSSGREILAAPRYFAGGEIASSGGKYTVRMKIKNKASKIYFIANTGDDALFNGVIEAKDIAAKTLAVTGEASLAPGGALPMCGLFSGTPTAANLGDGSITLTRAVAKVTFKLASTMPAGATFKLTGVKVRNIPQKLHPWRDLTKLEPGSYAGNCYPATNTGFAVELAVGTQADYDGFGGGTPITFPDFYLPENGRGTGTARKQQNKDADHALGGAEGQGNYATYVEVTGEYTGPDQPDTYNVTYRIYLGGDAVKDYNLLRNTHYTVTTTLKSPTDFDTRIETVFAGSTDTEAWDYTGKRVGWFVAAAADASPDKMTWADALTACPDGWRLPSLDELNIMYCMRDTWQKTSNGFSGGYYWSATVAEKDGLGNERAYTLNSDTGGVSAQGTDVSCHVRCVRDL